jgi:hypothetical protein
VKLTMRKCEDMGDWYVIERAEHDGRTWEERTGPHSSALRCSSRFSDADVEGYAGEMRALAKAIDERRYESFRRCAVDARTEPVKFWSPRNSQKNGEVTYTEAAALAAEIRATLATEGTGL